MSLLLLLETRTGVSTKLELVQVYCDGSGARPNLSKSSLLSPNRTMPCPQILDLTILGLEDPVEYLGFPFSQKPTHSMVISTLDKRFYDGFGVWFRRARTFRGQLLVAQTMISSRLWHYTMHKRRIFDRSSRCWIHLRLVGNIKNDVNHVYLLNKGFLCHHQ